MDEATKVPTDVEIARTVLDTAERAKAEASVGSAADFTKPVAVFNIDTVEPSSGTRYKGTFRTKVPTLRERDSIGLVTATLAGGVPWESLPGITRYRLERRATFTICIIEQPDWFKDPAAFLDDAVPSMVYSKIIEHFTTFFRLAEVAGGSPLQSSNDGRATAEDAG